MPDILLAGFQISQNAINWWILSTHCIALSLFFNGVKTISKRIANTGLKQSFSTKESIIYRKQQ